MKGNDKCSFRFSVLTKSYNMHTVQIQKVVERREAQAWKCLVSLSGTFFSQLFFNRWVKRCSVFAGEIFETGTRKIWWITFSFYRDRWSFQHRAQAAISSKASISSCAVCSVQWLCCVFWLFIPGSSTLAFHPDAAWLPRCRWVECTSGIKPSAPVSYVKGANLAPGEDRPALAAKMKATTDPCWDISLETKPQICSSFKFKLYTKPIVRLTCQWRAYIV